MREQWDHIDFPLSHGSTHGKNQSIAVRQNYAAMLENIGRNIGLMLEEVEKRGELGQWHS